MASRGYIELLRLADLAKARSSGRNSYETTQWTGIVFELAGQRLVAPMGEIAEVLSMPEFMGMPLVKPWLLGLANIRGRLLPLTDLAVFLKVAPLQTRMSQRKVLVVDEDKLFSGLVVDRVLGIQQFNSSQYQEESISDNSVFFRYCHGKFVKDNEDWFVFMPSILARDKNFSDAAK